jgi:bacterioferritin-associated ferredoxin
MNKMEDQTEKSKRQLIQGENVCNCFGITEEQLEAIFEETKGADFESLKKYYKVGSRCSACEIEVKDMLGEYRDRCRRVGGTLGSGRVPLARRFRSLTDFLRTEFRYWSRDRRFGMFVVRNEVVESSLVLSNLVFPEDRRNVNGEKSDYCVSLYDPAGKLIARRTDLSIASGHSVEHRLSELFPDFKDPFSGVLYVDFLHLREKGSLRPYCCFLHNKVNGKFIGRWHYHDQYIRKGKGGYWHNTHPFQPGKTCWMALANPIDTPYVSKVILRWKGRLIERQLTLPPNGSIWASLPEYFGVHPAEGEDDPAAMMWLDNPAALMVWFFWHKHDGHIWTAQHH